MLKLILALLLMTGVVAVASDAVARSCTTSCQTVGGTTTCSTYCW